MQLFQQASAGLISSPALPKYPYTPLLSNWDDVDAEETTGRSLIVANMDSGADTADLHAPFTKIGRGDFRVFFLERTSSMSRVFATRAENSESIDSIVSLTLQSRKAGSVDSSGTMVSTLLLKCNIAWHFREKIRSVRTEGKLKNEITVPRQTCLREN